MSNFLTLPIPPFFNPDLVGSVWRVPYQERAEQARAWANQYAIAPAMQDQRKVCLLAIDVQNTFCIPEFELFVGGRSGVGAIADNVRLCEFIYRNLDHLTEIAVTLDTHTAMQIFHPIFWINDAGEHPIPNATSISLADVQQGKWKVNPAIATSLNGGDYAALQRHAMHYVQRLSDDGKYPLTVWAYHSMLGGVGHALVASLEEAIFFHNIARHSQTDFQIKGGNPLTENYSALRPEVIEGVDGKAIAQQNSAFLQKLLKFDAIVIAGQAKSHCVAWTIQDLLNEILIQDPSLAKKVYLLEDCTSPVVVPDVVLDYTDQANAAFKRFAEAGMNLIKSTEKLDI
ncbi:MAG: isochorismatase [Oscillatoriales cyanobacterium CG2_30_44_21]|nr:MAG: isochorismatase [Oscillatoriales cyanobacterium CG2_30_44_21]